MARYVLIDVKSPPNDLIRSRELVKACFCLKTHRFLPLSVLRNRSKTMFLPIICLNAKVKISFKFNGFNKYHQLLPVRGDKDCVSPYYIVANGGRYYLLACREGNKEQEKNMSIWRVDLMSEIEIPKKNREEGSTGEPALPKDQVNNLPQSWSEDFHYQHLDMAFDKPVSIRLKVKSPKTADGENLRPDYTFLQDRFGNTFRYIAKDRSNPDFDIIRVICSPFGRPLLYGFIKSNHLHSGIKKDR